MSDLISRQDAIDALGVGAELLRRVLDEADIVGAEREKYEWGLGLIESLISDMKELPSAQPEQKTFSSMTGIEFEKWLYIHGIYHPDIYEFIPCKIVPLIIDYAINELPSAQPEQVMGKWMDTDNYYQRWKCSVCGCHTRDAKPPYCPNCGAKMED